MESNGVKQLVKQYKANVGYNLNMVKVCSFSYPKETKYTQLINDINAKNGYELHDFQKWCVEAIMEGHHVLACCPTGSGKTFGGEFAIEQMTNINKKVIYCSPIKALSNQKFYDFTRKYPNVSVGLITGDIKTNPGAQVLIMTTEILMNKLYQLKSKLPPVQSATSFEMDIMTELGCVVFDEIHMIADEARGHVWEQSIMLLPEHIQMVGLSATLDDPERFAYWLENRTSNKDHADKKQVYLTTKLERSVPLTHYNYITTHAGVFKQIKDKALQAEINESTNKLMTIQSAKGVFNDAQQLKTNKILKLFADNNIRVHRQHVLNNVCQLLVEKEMLPALCYVFSRKQLEICAGQITTNLLEFDSKVPYTVDRECEQIIRNIPNYKEYLHLPEYQNLVKLLQKGIGIHHAGLMPVLREMVELLFAKGFIKLLFCTETMSVGINLPVKTTIFTDINKFDGVSNRMLYGHEYTQAAGRAGRLGLDKVGHVIHLNNLFRDVSSVEYKYMLKGQPNKLISNFKISYNLLLNLIDNGDTNFAEYAKRSMMTNEIDTQLGLMYSHIQKLTSEYDKIAIKTPYNIIQEYQDMSLKKPNKQTNRVLKSMENEYPNLAMVIKKREEIDRLESEFNSVEQYIDRNVDKTYQLLVKEQFVTNNNELTEQGKVASNLREVNCLAFAKFMPEFKEMTSREIVSLFSCFTNVRVSEELKTNFTEDKRIKDLVSLCEKYEQQNDDNEIHYDLVNYVKEWCDASTEEECKLLLQKMGAEKEIFLGEFVKALLKINNIANEFEKVAELLGDLSLLSKLREIPHMTLKFVVTNQSLYLSV